MNAKFSFLKRLALGLAAVGIAVASTGTASAATKTWSGGNGTWAVASNWSTSGQPGNGDTALFNGVANKQVTVGASTAALAGITAGVNMSLVGNGPLNFQDGATFSIGSRTVSVAPAFNLKSAGSTSTLNLTGSGGTLNLGANALQLDFGLTGTLNVGNLTLNTAANWGSSADIVNNGTVKLSGNSGQFQGTTFNNTGGTLSGAGNGTYFTSSLGDLTLGAGTVNTYIGSTTAYDKWDTTSAVKLDSLGTLNLNFGSVTGAVNGTTWNIFKGDNTDNFGTLNASGTVNGVAVTFTQQAGAGSAWQSNDIGGGSFLVFKNNGDLVVVPEPSTIVFAGVGIAMAGWSAWKKRRLVKA